MTGALLHSDKSQMTGSNSDRKVIDLRCFLVVQLVNSCWDCRPQQENDGRRNDCFFKNVDSVVQQSVCSATQQDDHLLQNTQFS